MPPVRRRASADAAPTERPELNNLYVADLRALCTRLNLSEQGRRDTLIKRLNLHYGNDPQLESVAEHPVSNGGQDRESLPNPPCSSSPQLFNDSQMAQIQSLVSSTIQASIQEIASNAAKAAIDAMRNQQDPPRGPTNMPTNIPHDEMTPTGQVTLPTLLTSAHDLLSPNINAASNFFHDVPAKYSKDIHLGEFFELSKLLPKNLSSAGEDETVAFTVENSVIRLKKSTPSATTITDIDLWTTAFSCYMGILLQKYPNRAQELLTYMSTIRYAAKSHPGLGWCIYDYKFRQKAALQKSLSWAIIDSQLWLMIFTVTPSVLRENYPLFSNGPSNQGTSSGTATGGTCHKFNKNRSCTNEHCRYQHVCNRCGGPHPGTQCTRDRASGSQQTRDKESGSKQQRQ